MDLLSFSSEVSAAAVSLPSSQVSIFDPLARAVLYQGDYESVHSLSVYQSIFEQEE